LNYEYLFIFRRDWIGACVIMDEAEL